MNTTRKNPFYSYDHAGRQEPQRDWQTDPDPQYDEMGEVITDWATCGTCGRTWNDALITGLTPAPSARCPFEYEHTYDDDPPR